MNSLLQQRSAQQQRGDGEVDHEACDVDEGGDERGGGCGGIGSDASLGGEFEVQDPRGVATVMYAPQLTFTGPDGPSLGEAQRFRPKPGMLFVFPSWLQHGVRPYKGQRERISIAINFSVAGV